MNKEFINFIDRMAEISGQAALCESIKCAYKACLEGEEHYEYGTSDDDDNVEMPDPDAGKRPIQRQQQESTVKTSDIIGGTPLAKLGKFDMDSVFTANDSMQAALLIASEINKEAQAAGSELSDTKLWNTAKQIKKRLEDTGNAMLTSTFVRGINTSFKKFTGSGTTFK